MIFCERKPSHVEFHVTFNVVLDSDRETQSTRSRVPGASAVTKVTCEAVRRLERGKLLLGDPSKFNRTQAVSNLYPKSCFSCLTNRKCVRGTDSEHK